MSRDSYGVEMQEFSSNFSYTDDLSRYLQRVNSFLDENFSSDRLENKYQSLTEEQKIYATSGFCEILDIDISQELISAESLSSLNTKILSKLRNLRENYTDNPHLTRIFDKISSIAENPHFDEYLKNSFNHAQSKSEIESDKIVIFINQYNQNSIFELPDEIDFKSIRNTEAKKIVSLLSENIDLYIESDLEKNNIYFQDLAYSIIANLQKTHPEVITEEKKDSIMHNIFKKFDQKIEEKISKIDSLSDESIERIKNLNDRRIKMRDRNNSLCTGEQFKFKELNYKQENKEKIIDLYIKDISKNGIESKFSKLSFFDKIKKLLGKKLKEKY